MKINCVVIDDEILALNILEDFISKIPFLELSGLCNSSLEAIEVLNRENIDLIFLDINMPHLTGLELFNGLPIQPMVIITTAYSEYAIEGFNMNAVDYLLKPFSFERFVKSVNKAYELFTVRNKTSKDIVEQSPTSLDSIIVRSDYKTVKIILNEIVYIEGLKDYIKIYTSNKRYKNKDQSIIPIITKSTFIAMEQKLSDKIFLRVHKSFIINILMVDVIENNMILMGDKKIPIGKNYSKEFYLRLENMK